MNLTDCANEKQVATQAYIMAEMGKLGQTMNNMVKKL